ncbi:hypothetical protein E2320_022240 [Naja naja]|nr:hypothetical protein E2320_022240 [Naja naja]
MSASSLGGETPRSFSPAPLSALTSSQSTSALTEHGLFTPSQQPQQQPPALGISRGPSPVVLGSQGALPVATAFTEYIHAYFKGQKRTGTGGRDVGGPWGSPGRLGWQGAAGAPPALPSSHQPATQSPGPPKSMGSLGAWAQPFAWGPPGCLPRAGGPRGRSSLQAPPSLRSSCLIKVTGELTMSFPAGIVRVFSSARPPVLSFRLLHTAPIEQFLPNASLLFSDSSQSDPSSRDFWLNMAALTGHLQKQAEQSGAAPYYNVTLLRYQMMGEGGSWGFLAAALRPGFACGPGGHPPLPWDTWGSHRGLLSFWTTVPRAPSRLLGTLGFVVHALLELALGAQPRVGGQGCDAQLAHTSVFPDPLRFLAALLSTRAGATVGPLQLSVSWECGAEATRVSVDYRYNASALASAVALTNVQVLLPIEEPVANVQPQPKACW